MPLSEDDRAQRERAQQTWELVVHDAADASVLKAVRKILRVKRSELPALVARLPGSVRRGARIDLAPLQASLAQAGVSCELRRSKSAES